MQTGDNESSRSPEVTFSTSSITVSTSQAGNDEQQHKTPLTEKKKEQIKQALIVESVGCVLGILAGYVNAAAIILYSSAVGGLTGLTASTGIELEAGEDSSVGFTQIISFMGGSAFCGVVIGK